MKSTRLTTNFESVATLWRPFLLFLMPLMLTNILQSLSGTINTIFVGQLLGVNAVAAVSVFAPILFFLMAFVIGIASGSSILLGQAWGAQNIALVKRVSGTSLMLIVLLGITVAIVGHLFTQQAIELIGVPSAIRVQSIQYTHIMLSGIPLLFLFISYTSLMRGVGDSVTPMLAMIVVTLLGLLLTPALILGWLGLPQLGIVAPAVATLISQCIVLGCLYGYLHYRNHPLKLDKALWSHIRFQPDIARQIVRLGLPTAVQMVMGAISGLVIIGLVNQYGTQATAAYGAINQVLSYIQFPSMSIAIAASIFASQAIGAGNTKALNSVTRTALLVNLMITGSLIVIGYLFSRYLMALFITDNQVIALGQDLLHIVLWSIVLFSTSLIFSAMMKATGMVWPPMFISIGCILMVEIPAAILLSQNFGLAGIWWAYAITFTLMSVIQGLFYQLVWKKKAVQRLI